MIESERLLLKPLTADELKMYSRLNNEFENQFGYNHANREISKGLIDALNDYIFLNLENDPGNYLFYTLWIVVDKEINCITSVLAFQGKPDINGKIEIGYRTFDEFQNKGYITQAIGLLTEWAFKQNSVNQICAKTRKNNPASMKVLKNNDFILTNETDEMIFWKKTNPLLNKKYA